MYLRIKFSMPVLSENLIKAKKKCRPKLNMKLPSQQTSLAIHTIFSSAMLPKGKHSAEKLIEYSFFYFLLCFTKDTIHKVDYFLWFRNC